MIDGKLFSVMNFFLMGLTNAENNNTKNDAKKSGLFDRLGPSAYSALAIGLCGFIIVFILLICKCYKDRNDERNRGNSSYTGM